MDRLISIVYGAAMTLMLGGALCADSLAETPHGFVILFAVIGVAAALVWLGNYLEAEAVRQKRGRRR